MLLAQREEEIKTIFTDVINRLTRKSYV